MWTSFWSVGWIGQESDSFRAFSLRFLSSLFSLNDPQAQKVTLGLYFSLQMHPVRP